MNSLFMPKTPFRIPAVLILVVVSASSGVTPSRGAEAQPSEVAGSWEVAWVQFGHTNVNRVQLNATADKITGKAIRNLNLEGTLKGDRLELKLVDQEKRPVATLSGTVRGDNLSGVLNLNDNKFDI